MIYIARLLVLALTLSSTKLYAKLPEITVGFHDFAPLIYLNEQNQPQGPLYHFTQEILAHAGITGHYREMPSARLYQGLRKGQVQLWLGASGKPELEGYSLETYRPLGTLKLRLFYLKGRPAPRLPEDLMGKHLITLNGYNYWPATYQQLLAPAHGAIQLRTSSHQAAIELLSIGRGDYLLNYQAPTQYHAQKNELELDSLLIDEIPVRFIISAKFAQARTLRERLDNAYDRMLFAGKRLNLEYY